MRVRSIRRLLSAASGAAAALVTLVGAPPSGQTQAEAPESETAATLEWDRVEAEATATDLLVAIESRSAGAGDLPPGVVSAEDAAQDALRQAIEEADRLVAAIGAGASREETRASFERLNRLVHLASAISSEALRGVLSDEEATAAARLFKQLRAYHRLP